MILFRYLFRRLTTYTILFDIVLAFVFNFVEFFEKLVRAKDIPAKTIVQLLSLNVVPSAFSMFPISVWLGFCFILKELNQKNEWDLLYFTTYLPRRFFSFSLIMGIFFAGIAFTAYEWIGSDTAFRAEQFKQDHLKQSSNKKLVGKWFELSHNRISYFSFLDLEKHIGSDLLVISTTPPCLIASIVRSPYFSINPSTNSITIPQGQILNIQTNEDTEIKDYVIHSPAFFSQLRTNFESPSLINTAQKLIVYRPILPEGVYHELLHQLYLQIIYYLQIILYPIFTLSLFLLFRRSWLRWLAVLSPYPIFMLTGMFSDVAGAELLPPIILVLPYLAIAILIFLFWRSATSK